MICGVTLDIRLSISRNAGNRDCRGTECPMQMYVRMATIVAILVHVMALKISIEDQPNMHANSILTLVSCHTILHSVACCLSFEIYMPDLYILYILSDYVHHTNTYTHMFRNLGWAINVTQTQPVSAAKTANY